MTRLFIVFFCVFGVSLITSCVSTNTYYPVQNNEPRINSNGFSISPPPGKNWYERHKDDSLIYLKKIESEYYSIFAKATETHLIAADLKDQSFTEYVRGKKHLNLPDGRYKNALFSIHEESSGNADCARYLYTYEDHGQDALPQGKHVMVENSGIICRHPDTPKIAIDMYYVERSVTGSESMSYRDEAEIFLGSLRFQRL